MKNKRIFYIFHGRYPSQKAASLFAAKSAAALAGQGVETILIVPRRRNRLNRDPYEYYGVPNTFETVYVPTIDLFGIPLLTRIAFMVSNIIFALCACIYVFFSAGKADLVYSNEALPVLIASYFFSETFYEVHDFPEHKIGIYGTLLRRVKYILATNSWKKDELQDRFKVPANKIICEPNAVDVSSFDIPIEKNEARTKLNYVVSGAGIFTDILVSDMPIAVYTGHLYSWKGVDTLAQAAPHVKDIRIVFVGGTAEDVMRFKKKYGHEKNISIIGHRPYCEMPLWQKAADMLILPNTAKEAISRHYTSPMKLFEYMASGRPIVASRIPSIEEILNEKNAILVAPDEPKKLAETMSALMNNPELQANVSAQARADVAKHTWEARAQRIVGFIGEIV